MIKRFCVYFYTRGLSCIDLVRNRKRYVLADSYYSEFESKSRVKIFFQQLGFILRYGSFEPFYFLYGFDKKEMSKEKMAQYITPYWRFQKKIDRLNIAPPKYGRFHGRTLTFDKYYFGLMLEKLGFPTPRLFCYVKQGKILYLYNQDKESESISNEDNLRHFLLEDKDAFVKPSDGQLGIGIFSLKVENQVIYKNDEEITLDQLCEILSTGNYLIQERVYQHQMLSELCPYTLNTIRLQTVMTNEGNVLPFGAGLRIGRKGNVVDNWAKGGVFVGIDMDKGELFKYGFLKPQFGTKIDYHVDTQVVFEGVKIPYFKEAVEGACALHQQLYRMHSIGWDIAITEHGYIFIEANGLWEISLVQAVHGGLKEVEQYF